LKPGLDLVQVRPHPLNLPGINGALSNADACALVK